MIFDKFEQKIKKKIIIITLCLEKTKLIKVKKYILEDKSHNYNDLFHFLNIEFNTVL